MLLKNKWLEKNAKDVRLFEEIFKVKLSDFFDGVCGLDIVKFDEWLKTPDGTSTARHVRNVYGKKAVLLVKRLL